MDECKEDTVAWDVVKWDIGTCGCDCDDRGEHATAWKDKGGGVNQERRDKWRRGHWEVSMRGNVRTVVTTEEQNTGKQVTEQ